MKKRILISIDHKWRDLPGHVLLGEYLRKLGSEVTYCRNGLEKFFLENSCFDLVIVNHIFENARRELILNYKNKDVKFIIFPTEGIPTLDDLTDFGLGVNLDYSNIELYVFWNSYYKARFIENKTLTDSKIYVSGVPRFDFYKEPFKSEITSTSDPYTSRIKTVLWATNFTQAQFHDARKFALMDADAQRLGYKKELIEMKGDLRTVAELDFQARERSVEIVSQYLEKHDEVTIVLKPHPSEDLLFYKSYFKDRGFLSDRLILVEADYIWKLLSKCDVEISRSCTTAVEAWHLGKPTIDLNPVPQWNHSSKHANGSIKCHDYATFESAMSECLSSNYEVPQKLLSKRMHFIERYCEGLSCDRTKLLAQFITQKIQHRNQSNYACKKNIFSLIIYVLLKHLDHLPHNLKVYGARYFIGNRYDKFGRLDKYFHYRDVRRWQDKFRKNLN